MTTSHSNAAPGQGLPLRLGGAEDFARVEAALGAAGFDEATVCRLLNIEDMFSTSQVRPEQVRPAAAGSAPLALLLRLFLLLEAVPRGEVEPVLDGATLDSFRALDLLRLGAIGSQARGEWYYSSVLLYPYDGLWLASDRYTNPDGSESVLPPDYVFPAIHPMNLPFLRMIPQSPAQDVLDLCSGTGVAALVLSRRAGRVVAADITARCAHFARFNRLLNRRQNVEVLQGDLYSPVEDSTFDRIAGHPPFVPSLSDEMVYRDAGETGEALIKRMVEGLPRHLRPGGTFYAVSAGWDTTAGTFERRARGWLGAGHGEFDIIFGLDSEVPPAEAAREMVEQNPGAAPGLQARWEQLFNRIGARSRVHGALVIRRREAGAADQPLTRRVRVSRLTDGACFEWALRWHQWRRGQAGGLAEAVRATRPRLGTYLQARIAYVVHGGGLVPAEARLEAGKPFLAETEVDPWLAPVLGMFDGRQTTREVYEAARRAAVLPGGVTADKFTLLVAGMIERGFLEIDESVLTG